MMTDDQAAEAVQRFLDASDLRGYSYRLDAPEPYHKDPAKRRVTVHWYSPHGTYVDGPSVMIVDPSGDVRELADEVEARARGTG